MTGAAAVIGAGRFGRFLAARLLAAGVRVVVADRRAVRVRGVRRVPLEEAARCRVVILALPARDLRAALRRIAPLLAPGTIVCDVCAVKEAPARWMREVLPPSVPAFGLHPLFGPSGAGGTGFEGGTIVLCPVRLSPRALGRVRRFLRSLGLRVVTSTPGAHDRAMARTLVVTQFVGRALAGLVPASGPLRTRNAEALSRLIRASSADAPHVLDDLLRFNRYARRAPGEVLRRVRALEARLERRASSPP